MSDLQELQRDLVERGDQPVRAGDLLRFMRAFAQHADVVRETVQTVKQYEERLLIVDELPDSAPFGALIRRRGTAALFLGNGLDQPLSRLVPQAV